MYAAGRGVPRDEKTALKFFERAASLETEKVLLIFDDDASLSPSLKRDYLFSIHEGRHPAGPGAVVERDKLAAKFRAQEPPPVVVAPAKAEEFCPRLAVTFEIWGPLPPLTLTRSRAGGATDLDSAVDFKAENAGAGNVAHAFAELLGSDLMIDVGLKGKVTFDRKSVLLREALDAFCAQVSCTWSLDHSNSRPALYVQMAQRHATSEK